MICPLCNGRNGRVCRTAEGVTFIYRCLDPACPPGGTLHCCDGLCEQPAAWPTGRPGDPATEHDDT